MNEPANNNAEHQKTFKANKKALDESEIRGAYAKTTHHKDIKKIIKVFSKHREQILLFIHSLDQ